MYIHNIHLYIYIIYTYIHNIYNYILNYIYYVPGADKSLARPGRKQATATKL